MLTPKEKQFIIHWKNVRLVQRTFKYKILAGLPMAIIFSVPILFFFGIIKIFLPSWFTTASHRQADIILPPWSAKFMTLSTGDIVMAFIAILLLILFFSFFRMQYKWEINEQLYQELSIKEKLKN